MGFKKINRFAFFILLIITTMYFYSCNLGNGHITFSDNVIEVVKNMKDEDNNTDYEDYVKVAMKEPEILPVTNKQGNDDSENCYISQNLTFQNITSKKIKFNCRIFLTKDFLTIAYAPTYFGFIKEITLEPGQYADASAAIIMKKIELLTNKEKEIYDKNSGKVFVELKINNNYYCFAQEVTSD